MNIAAHLVVTGSGALPLRAVARAVAIVFDGEGRVADLSITFLGVAAMQRLNQQYKHHDRPTDVIAFPLPQPDGSLAGDVYICRAMAAREARGRGIPVREELLRLVVHGTLHVLGHEHPEDGSREQSRMWRQQERYLQAVA